MIDMEGRSEEVAVDIAAGIKFEDPYRWLEDNDAPAVKQWQEKQNQAASNYVRAWPYFGALEEQVHNYMVPKKAIPVFAGDNYFRVENNCVVVAKTPFGEGTIVFDLSAQNGFLSAVLLWISPSPDGRLLAVGVCSDGSEKNTIQLVDVRTKELLPNPPDKILMDGFAGASWLPDNTGFYFSAFTGDPAITDQSVFFYRLSSGELTEQEIPLVESGPLNAMIVTFSDTGRYHIFHQGLVTTQPVAILDTAQVRPVWKSFVTNKEGTVVGQLIGDQYYALTYVGAPRGRIVKISVDTQTPNDADTWIEYVNESCAVMRSLTYVDGYFYLHELVDSYSQIRVIDTAGITVDKVPLPDKAIVDENYYMFQHLAHKQHPNGLLFSYSTFTQSWGVYHYRYSAAKISNPVKTLLAPEINITQAVVEDHWVETADATMVLYQSVRLESTDMSSPQPTLLFAYGSFGVPWPPEYLGSSMAFVMAGGIYILGHPRGGGEFGIDWWCDGRRQKKQNTYDDVYAIAQDMISKGYTSSDQLALTGRSSGGHMAGVALTQRPSLWRAVVPQVGVFDFLGGLRDPYTRQVIEAEFIDPENQEEVLQMVKYSPYHLINRTSVYPAIYIVAGSTDSRCLASQSRKFAARLQQEGNGERPVLLHVWNNAGHGAATAGNIELMQFTDWLAFIMNELKLTPCSLGKQR